MAINKVNYNTITNAMKSKNSAEERNAKLQLRRNIPNVSTVTDSKGNYDCSLLPQSVKFYMDNSRTKVIVSVSFVILVLKIFSVAMNLNFLLLLLFGFLAKINVLII